MADTPRAEVRTLFGHPMGLYVLFFTEMWERFSFYGMRALLILYMVNHFLWSQQKASSLFGTYAMLAYGLPVFGGLIADRYIGARRAVVLGGVLLVIGHFLMAFEPLPTFYMALCFIVLGVGFLKPNVSTQVGALYKPGDPRRDPAFTIFYMGINLGAMFGPLLCGWLRQNYGYHYGFAAAGVGMLFGLLVYVFGQRKLVEFNQEAPAIDEATHQVEVAPHVARDRIIVLLVVFVFVMLFWSAFEQSANAMVIWADKHTNLRLFTSEPAPVAIDAAERVPSEGWAKTAMTPEQTQSINPFFIVVLAPVFAALWMWLEKRKLQPSTPTKMAMGLALVGVAFAVMLPAALHENGSTAVALTELPSGTDLSKYGATRLSYDASARQLRMQGVLPDIDRLKLLEGAASPEFRAQVAQLVDAASASAQGGGKWEAQASIAAPPAGLRIEGAEAGKVFRWDEASRTLSIQDRVNDRAKAELLATTAPAEFKAAMDALYVQSAAFRPSVWWLVAFYMVLTMGELCLSPVGLSLVTKLAPARHVGLFMGLWFFFTAMAEKIAHLFGEYWGTMPPVRYFSIFIVIGLVGALVMSVLVRSLKRKMHGVH